MILFNHTLDFDYEISQGIHYQLSVSALTLQEVNIIVHEKTTGI